MKHQSHKDKMHEKKGEMKSKKVSHSTKDPRNEKGAIKSAFAKHVKAKRK